MESLERLKISEGLSYFGLDVIVLAVECMRLQMRSYNAFVASTLTDKAINVLQNPMNCLLVQI
jgi:hypothetical protein